MMYGIFKTKYLWILAAVISVMLSGCGGPSSSASTAGFAQTYTTSAGAGEVLQFSVDTANLTYSYTVIQTSYGVTLGQTGTGTLISKN